MSLAETARLLDVPEQSVLRWARKGALPCRTVQGEALFAKPDVIAWAKRMGMRLRDDKRAAAPKPEPNALARSIARGGLVEDLQGTTPVEVLRDLVSRAQLPAGLSGQGLLDHLLAREQLASTAVGDGFALPHPRQPLGPRLGEPIVVVGRLAQPIDWAALDDKPVHTAILVLSSSLQGHLDLLKRIAMTLKVDELHEAIAHEHDLGKLCERIEAHPE